MIESQPASCPAARRHARATTCIVVLALVATGCGGPAAPLAVEVAPPPVAAVTAPAPLMPDEARAELARARAAWDDGDHSPAIAAALERAGRALQQSGVKRRGFAALSHEHPRATADGRVHLPIADQHGDHDVLALFAIEDTAKARAGHRAPRLLPRTVILRPGADIHTTVAADGAILASSERGAWLFPSVDRVVLLRERRAMLR